MLNFENKKSKIHVLYETQMISLVDISFPMCEREGSNVLFNLDLASHS